MAPPPVVALDSDILILLLSAVNALTAEDAQHRRSAMEHISSIEEDRGRFLIPAPVFVELGMRRTVEAIQTGLGVLLNRAQPIVLNATRACAAGEWLAEIFSLRPQNTDRVRVKFDMLNAALADQAGATHFLTGDVKGMSRIFESKSSPVVVVDMRKPPKGKTMTLPGIDPPRRRPRPARA